MVPALTIGVALLAVSAYASPAKRDERPIAVIDLGAVVGTTTSLPSSETTVNQFLGIPFGKKPERFSPPEPAESWFLPYDATKLKPACMQKFNYPPELQEAAKEAFNTPPPPAGESEDCLTLNVFAPAGAEPGSKAVLFWLFGGTYHFGAGSLPLYDGSEFAAHEDIIVVTSNYRTNIFGFPGSPDLPPGEGNLGYHDQRLALAWVQRNIVAFGGDPRKVTIVGESAGASSADAIILNPDEPLAFRAAILQSGQLPLWFDAPNSTEAWINATIAAGCDEEDDELACMRAIPAEDLQDLVEENMLNYAPQRDGNVTYPDFPRQRRLESTEESSLMARVPLLIGTTADEGRVQSLMGVDLETALNLYVPPGTIPQEAIDMLLEAYAIGLPGINNEFDQVSRFATEMVVQCPVKYVAEDSQNAGIPTWRFFYNASFPNSELFEGSGAYHSAELDILFGTYEREGATEFQHEFSAVMRKVWADFVKEPENGPGWGQIPEIGILGAGVRPGAEEPLVDAVVAVDVEVVDWRCQFYKDFYDAFSLGA